MFYISNFPYFCLRLKTGYVEDRWKKKNLNILKHKKKKIHSAFAIIFCCLFANLSNKCLSRVTKRNNNSYLVILVPVTKVTGKFDKNQDQNQDYLPQWLNFNLDFQLS